jgi:hypothetical protein
VRRIALVALLFPLLAAGCGGGSDKTTTGVDTRVSPGPTSKEAYLGHADTICHNHQSRREDLEGQATQLGPLTSKAKAHRAANLLRKESANRTAEVAELHKLPPPSADAATLSSILGLVRDEAKVIDAWAEAYDDGDQGAIRRLQIRLGLTAGRAARRARAYGFEVCGQQ